MASFPPQKLLFLSLFLLISPFSKNHEVSGSSSSGLAKKMIKSFNLSPKYSVSTHNAETTLSESESESESEEASSPPHGIIEKQFKFPNLAAPAPSVQDLGHHAGYYNLQHSKAASMFYYFFESRSNKADPVVIWLTGGPGCSSSLALFYENGPFHINKDLSLVWNDFGWDQASNILFVDQPIGTGFSYTTDETDYRSDEEGVSNDLYDFLQAFFKQHPEFVMNEFYVTGESYAGHYVPALAGRINKGNKAKEGIHINLKGMAIGNGMTNPRIQYPAYPDYALNMSLIQKSDYDDIKQQVPDCVQSAKACETQGSGDVCESSLVKCQGLFSNILFITGNINYYDVRKQCEGDLCYDFSAVETLLNQKSVKDELGVGNIEFVSCSTDVHERMEGDWMRNLAVGIPELLEDGIKVLLYEGEYDLICNWLGNSMWVDALSWSGQKEFVAAPSVVFSVDGKEAGRLKSHGALAFLKVYNAGHMVPMDQPKNALEMLKSWMQGKLALYESETTSATN